MKDNIYDIVARNILAIMKEKNISIYKLSTEINVTQSVLNKFLTRYQHSIKLDIIELVAKGLNVKLEDLMREDFITSSDNSNQTSINEEQYTPITFYDVKVSAGSGELIENANSKIIQISKELGEFHYPTSDLFAVKVSGDSMQPTFHEDDILFVHDLRKDVYNFVPGVYIIEDDFQGLKVKRLDMDKYGNLLVMSDNTKYKEVTYSQDEVNGGLVRIIGKVIALLTRY